MKVEVFPHPEDKTPGATFEAFTGRVAACTNLWQLLIACCEQNAEVTIMRNPHPDFGEALTMFIQRRLYQQHPSHEPVAMIAIESAALKKQYKFDSLLEQATFLPETKQYIVNEEWLEARDAKLKIRPRGEHGEMFIGAASLFKLLFSYVFSSLGHAEIRRTLIEDYNNRVHDSLWLHLVFVGEEEQGHGGWQEGIYLPLAELSRYVERHKKDKPEFLLEFYGLDQQAVAVQ